MVLRVYLVVCMALVFVNLSLSQTQDTAIHVKYIGNLGSGDSVVNITNTGAAGVNLCANVYVFAPDEQLVSCCTCVVTPNGLVSLSARNDLINNPLTPAVPSSIVVKIVGSTGTCNASSVAAGVAGLMVWGTSLHIPPFVTARTVTETPFTTAAQSVSELTRITRLCGFIQSNGSGYGICSSCRAGALGGAKK